MPYQGGAKNDDGDGEERQVPHDAVAVVPSATAAHRADEDEVDDTDADEDEDDEEDTDHIDDPPALSRGADLLLSLTKDRKKVVITPMDSMSACFDGSMTSLCSSGGSSNSSSKQGGPLSGEKHHRLLYHSPIKVSSSHSNSGSGGLPATLSSQHHRLGGFSDGSFSSGRHHAHAPVWSPSSLNGMGHPVFHASFGRSPTTSMPIRQMNFDNDDHSCSLDGSTNSATSKRLRDEVEEKKDEDESLTDKPNKQRLISPSSSNEKPEDESESSLNSHGAHAHPKGSAPHYPYPWGMPHAPPHPAMYAMHAHAAPPPHAHWPPPKGGYPPPHAPPPPPHAMPYPPPHPHYAMYPPPHYPPHQHPHQHPPWGMYGGGPPPPGSAHATTAGSATASATALSHPPIPLRMRPENQAEKGKATSLSKFPNSNIERCVLVSNPIPNKFWSNGNAAVPERTLPEFTRLVNFPDFLSRGRHHDKAVASSPDGLKPCVMCGQMRRCSASSPANSDCSATARRPKQAKAASAAAAASGSASTTTEEKALPTHIIPRQNKGVCTVCDVAVWLFRDATDCANGAAGVEIKWCKGCKNFRPWSAFGEKGAATKCARCRQRQREKYAFQKNNMEASNNTSTSVSSLVPAARAAAAASATGAN